MTKSKNTDFWADVVELDEFSPKELMKEQASYLKLKTKGLLIAEITTRQVLNPPKMEKNVLGYISLVEPKNNVEKFIQIFSIVVPTLKYRYDLFSVYHPILGYPVEFRYDDQDELIIANNEQEFLDILKQILSSDKTRRILAALLAQARP